MFIYLLKSVLLLNIFEQENKAYRNVDKRKIAITRDTSENDIPTLLMRPIIL